MNQKNIYFSVFYGLDYYEHHRNNIFGPHYLRNSLDTNQIQFVFKEENIIKIFENQFLESSELRVFKIINLVFILRMVLNK